MVSAYRSSRTKTQMIVSYLCMAIGSFLAALSIRVFLFPNELIDGGIVGIGMILTRLTSQTLFPLYFSVLTIPFVYLSYRFIRRTFFVQMTIAILLFVGFMSLLTRVPTLPLNELETIVVGGATLGIGAGLIIRSGGCLDGTEILAIIINRRFGFTVGQVVLAINIVIFAAYGLIFRNWHVAFSSLLLYVVAFKMMDIVIVGLDELKSVMIISQKPDKLTKLITGELGLGLTIMYGRGGYSGEEQEILFVIVERLDLADLKEIVLREDPTAFVAIENLHEFVSGKQSKLPVKKRARRKSKQGTSKAAKPKQKKRKKLT
ncbi:MAG: YitT family protein [Chlamydiota bacterium]